MKKNSKTRKKNAIALKCCPDCGNAGEGALFRKHVTHEWKEGVHEKRQYSAEIDVIACTKCGAQVIDEYARLQQHEVWCKENGLLGPRAIRDLRRNLKLSREDFAKLLRLGSASVSRWERGVVVQNAALDSLMRLLARKENVHDLATWAGVSVPAVTGTATTRLVAEDGTKGPWTIKHSEYYEETDEVRKRAAKFPLSIRTA
jgi:putative zinc finger/helix-turn-helix YgiT family protein